MLPNLHSNRLKSEIKGTKMWMGVVYAYINICMYMIKVICGFIACNCLKTYLENLTTTLYLLVSKVYFRKYFEICLRGNSIIESLGHQSGLKQGTPFH